MSRSAWRPSGGGRHASSPASWPRPRPACRRSSGPRPPMLESITATLERFRIHFDSFALQSELESRIGELLDGLPTYEHEGATWLRSSEYGDEQDRVIIRSPERGGRPTYRAADIVY